VRYCCNFFAAFATKWMYFMRSTFERRKGISSTTSRMTRPSQNVRTSVPMHRVSHRQSISRMTDCMASFLACAFLWHTLRSRPQLPWRNPVSCYYAIVYKILENCKRSDGLKLLATLLLHLSYKRITSTYMKPFNKGLLPKWPPSSSQPHTPHTTYQFGRIGSYRSSIQRC